MQRARFWIHASAFLLLSLFVVIAVGCDGGDSGMDEEPPDETPQGNVEDVRINEIHEGEQWVELFNTGDEEVDVSELWLCVRPNYSQISDLTVQSGNTTIPAGGYLVVEWDAIQSGEGEMGLYETDAFGSADAILDYMQYGAAGQGRASVAVEAGLWDEGEFADAAAEGQTIAFFGGGSSAAENWGIGNPTPGAANEEVPSATLADIRINEIHEGEQWVELFNTGATSVDASELWLCVRPAYSQAADLNVLSGNTTIPAGGYLVVEWDAIQSGEGEMGLYETDAFGSADAILDYMQYGAAGQGRASVAVEAGLWDEGTYVTSAAEGQTLAFLGGGDTPVENWGFGTPTQGAENQVSSQQAVQYTLSANTNSGAIPDGVSATATFQALNDTQTLVTLALDDGPTGTNLAHPAHIHLNSAEEGGSIEIYLTPIDGLDQPNNNATSTEIIDQSLSDMLRFGGHINIHESNANLGNVIARGDIGANARGLAVDAVPIVDSPESVTYDLAPNANNGMLANGVSATVEFLELGDSQTLVTISLPDGPTDTQVGHPSHIHMNSAEEGGGIEIYIAPIDGLAHPNNDATSSQIVARSYDELTGFNGHVNVHESNANLGNVIARGDIGANAQ